MLLTLLQQNLASSIKARVSWLQVKPDAKASLVATEAQDVLTATATAAIPAYARVSWLQVKAAVRLAELVGTEQPDSLTATALMGAAAAARVSWLQVRPNIKARVSWLQVRPVALTASLIATEASESLSATVTTVPPTYARVSWLQVRGNRVANLSVTEASDVLTAGVTPIDKQVAGSWTPAMKSRWMVLDGSSILPPITADLDATEASDALVSASVLTQRTALLTATESPDSLVAAAIGRIRTAQLADTEAPDQLTASAVALKLGDSLLIGGPDEDPSEFDRAMMERIKYREDKRVAMNNAVAMSVVALLCEVLE